MNAICGISQIHGSAMSDRNRCLRLFAARHSQAAQGRAQPLTSGATSRSRSATRLACVECADDAGVASCARSAQTGTFEVTILGGIGVALAGGMTCEVMDFPSLCGHSEAIATERSFTWQTSAAFPSPSVT